MSSVNLLAADTPPQITLAPGAAGATPAEPARFQSAHLAPVFFHDESSRFLSGPSHAELDRFRFSRLPVTVTENVRQPFVGNGAFVAQPATPADMTTVPVSHHTRIVVGQLIRCLVVPSTTCHLVGIVCAVDDQLAETEPTSEVMVTAVFPSLDDIGIETYRISITLVTAATTADIATLRASPL